MFKNIMLILIGKRRKSATEVQKLLTEYGCYIKTRLGMHEASDTYCSDNGLIFLELAGDEKIHMELFNKLQYISCVDAKLQKMETKNC